MAEERPPENLLDAKDLLLADLQHFESAMARNEETGEKRFSFLISLLTAVGGGLGALYTSMDVVPARVLDVAAGGSLALAGFAFLTWLRMVHRNRVTDRHKATLRHIRETYQKLCPPLQNGYEVPVGGSRLSRLFRGGYAETTGVVTAVLLGVSVWLGIEADWISPEPAWLAFAVGLATAIVLVGVAPVIRSRDAAPTGSENPAAGSTQPTQP
jgi:hypothetical protein